MAFGGLKVLPSFLVILLLIVLYVRNLVAIVDQSQPELQGVFSKETGDEKGDSFKFESLSASLSSDNDELNVISNLASSVPINFDPPQMDFIDQAVGMATIKEIRINNPTHSLTLQLISISGSQPDFHSSFFVSKVLRPGESTTFEIVFLPRILGLVQDTLIIQSSFGTYKYKITGIGINNIFRLRPLRGARIPINATYSPSISFYNPFDSPLQIIELYSSGSSLHLELPHGFTQGNKSVWEIRPYETKQIAKASFVGQYISNQTAFIRIKTSHPSNPSIVLPVEVEVSEASGLFLSRELLDFGMIKSGGQTRLPLYVLNAGPHSVVIKSIIPDPDNPHITVEYTNTTLKPSGKYIKVAILIFSVDTYPPIADIEDSGFIKIWAEDKASFHQLTVPYETHILQGVLDYEPSDTLFRAHDPPFSPIIRSISLLNRFLYPIVIYSAKLSTKAQDMFTVDDFQSPYILNPDGKWHEPIILRFHPHSSECLMNTTLRLATNTSFFNIPLQCYDGSLEHDFGGKEIDALEFGLMSDRDSRAKVFSITNPNPVQISVTSIQVNENSNIPFVAVHLLSLPPQPKNHDILPNGYRKGRRPPYYIAPGHQMVFSVNVTHPKRPGKFSGEIIIYSSLGKMVAVPVNYQAVSGGVHITPKHIKFNPALPYSKSSVRVHIKSTYTKPIRLLSLSLSPHNTTQRPLPVAIVSTLSVINPSTTTVIGEVVLDPLMYMVDFNKSYELKDLDYTSSGTKLTKDLQHFISLWEAWQSLINNEMQSFEFKLIVDTEVDKDVAVSGTGSIRWPRLFKQSPTPLQFPVTLIGNTSEISFSIYNPSNTHLHVELILLTDGVDHESILQTLSNKYSLDSSQYTNMSERVYSIVTRNYKHSSDRTTSYKKFPKFILPPYGNQSLDMTFSPVSDYSVNGLLLLRNNVTIFDYIELKGLGSRGFITVGGVHPGGPFPLLFEYSPSMMEECTTATDCECGITANDPSYTKTFLVRNSGLSPIMVSGTLGTNGLCENHGFHIHTCEKPFTVYPNKTRRIDITCSPDYTLSRITSNLRLTTSTGLQMDFPLMATLPHNLLVSCYSSLPRSELEALASYVSVPLWLLALLVMIVATIFQVNWHTRRLHQSLVPTPSGKDVPVQSTGGTVFDLSNIALRVSTTITDKMAELGRNVQTSNVTTDTVTLSNKDFCNVEKEMSSCQDISIHQPMNQSNQLGSPDEPVSDTLELCEHVSVDDNAPDPVETTPLLQALSSPSKKSKAKRMYMKVEKSQIISSSSSSTSNLSDDTDPTTVINLIKTEQLSRKESDDSIAESDQDQYGSSNGSEQSSVTPDPEDSVTNSTSSSNGIGKCPSFTKEPGTGQTVMVKDGVEESESGDKLKQMSSVVSVSVNVGKQQRNKSKKQRAQQKREEKGKKRRKEKEKEEINKKVTEPHESFDKESVSSSTNSTENLDEDNPSNEQDETGQTPDNKKSPERTLSKKPVPDNSRSVEDSSQVTEDKIQPVINIDPSQLPSAVEDVSLEDDEEANLLEMETSCSSIEFRTPGLSPSPDELTVTNKIDALPHSKSKEEVPTEDMFTHTSDNKKFSKNTTSSTAKTTTNLSSPNGKPKIASSFPSTPGKSMSPVTTTKTRPKKLDLSEATDDSQSSPTLSSVETDGTRTKGRLAPHELAASLLKKIPLPQKQKQSNSNQEKDTEDSATNTVRVQSSNNRKKSNDNNNMSIDNGRDKRQTPLSSDAMPFFPPQHTDHHYSHPHNIPPPMPQPFPPNRAPLPPPQYPPHYLLNSPYEYQMRRPPVYPHDDQVHQFERKQRKRSDQKYPPKPFSPPAHPEPLHYHDRPQSFPMHNYDSPNEWMDSRGSHMGYSEEDPFALSYPAGHRRSGYTRGANGPPYGFTSDMPPSMGSRSMDSPESIWDSNQLTPDEVIYLNKLRRQRLKKIIEKHQLRNNETLEPPMRHSSDPYSLASLREIDQTRYSRSDMTYPQIETGPMMTASFRNHDEVRRRSREDPFTWPTAPELLNRAPGPPGSFHSESLGQTLSSPEKSSVLSNDGHSLQGLRDNFKEPKKTNSPSTMDDVNGAWHSLWTMQTPLLSALEEQRQKAAVVESAEETDDNNTYDLFEQSTHSIWSLNDDDPPFPWFRKSSKSNRN